MNTFVYEVDHSKESAVMVHDVDIRQEEYHVHTCINEVGYSSKYKVGIRQ